MSLVIIDRDGVINFDSDDYIKSAEEWRAIPGSLEAIARLSQTGFTVAVATNQSGLARGLFDLDDLESMHAKFLEQLAALGGEVAGIFYCPHHPDDKCHCRKPEPGLIEAIENELGQPAAGAWFVGDSLKDMEAALSKSCRPILVRSGKGERTEARLTEDMRAAVLIVDDLAAAADYIARQAGD